MLLLPPEACYGKGAHVFVSRGSSFEKLINDFEGTASVIR